MARLGVHPGQAVFVGDHPKSMCLENASRGNALHVASKPRLSPVVEADAVIDELGDLLSLLGLERSAP